MLTAKVFQSGNSQAIRIPNEVRTEKSEFIIQQFGEGYILLPTNDPWAALRASIGTLPDDFMEDRRQPSWGEVSQREGL